MGLTILVISTIPNREKRWAYREPFQHGSFNIRAAGSLCGRPFKRVRLPLAVTELAEEFVDDNVL